MAAGEKQKPALKKFHLPPLRLLSAFLPRNATCSSLEFLNLTPLSSDPDYRVALWDILALDVTVLGTSCLLTDDYFSLSLPGEVILVGRLEVLCSGFQGGRLSNCFGDFQAVLVNAGCKSLCKYSLSLPRL